MFFLEDVDRLRRLKNHTSDGSQSFSGARLFHFDVFSGFDVPSLPKRISANLKILAAEVGNA